MPRTRSPKRSDDSPSQPTPVLPESEVAASSGLQPPVEDPVFADEDESRPEAGGQVQSAASLLFFQLRTLILGPQLGRNSLLPCHI